MQFKRIIWLPAVLMLALPVLGAETATDAQRIAALEAQLEQQRLVMDEQRRLLEAMQVELRQLQASSDGSPAPSQDGVAPAFAALPETEPEAARPPLSGTAAAVASGAAAARDLSMTVYGFAQADAIYDFKRVDPDWQDTLRVTTIPTQGGADGNEAISSSACANRVWASRVTTVRT